MPNPPSKITSFPETPVAAHQVAAPHDTHLSIRCEECLPTVSITKIKNLMLLKWSKRSGYLPMVGRE